MPTPPKPPAPPAPQAQQQTQTVTTPSGKKFKLLFRKPDTEVGHRVLVYGKPGSGKTTLMLRGLPKPLVVFDFDNSLGVLLAKPQEQSGIDPTDILIADNMKDSQGRVDYGNFLGVLSDPSNFDGVRSVLIDTGTFAEAAIEPYMFANPEKYPTGNKGCPRARSLADYAFRGGNIYKDDLYKLMLAYLENLTKKHIHVGIVYHTAVGKVPNLKSPDGSSLQYQPSSWSAGKTSLAETAMGWCDHVGAIKSESVMDTLTVGKDKDGTITRSVEKATGDSTICFAGDGEYIGKSRTLYGDAATVPLDEFDLSMLGIK